MKTDTQNHKENDATSVNFVTGFGDQLRLWRKASGLTQEELANLTDVNVSWISNLERNFHASKKDGTARPSESLVDKFAEVLGVDRNEIRLLAGYAPVNAMSNDLVIINFNFEGIPAREVEKVNLLKDLLEEQLRKLASQKDIEKTSRKNNIDKTPPNMSDEEFENSGLDDFLTLSGSKK